MVRVRSTDGVDMENLQDTATALKAEIAELQDEVSRLSTNGGTWRRATMSTSWTTMMTKRGPSMPSTAPTMKAMPRRGSSFSTSPVESSFASVAMDHTLVHRARRVRWAGRPWPAVLSAVWSGACGLVEPGGGRVLQREVAEELAIDGVYVAPGRDDIDEEQLVSSLQEARARGLRLVVTAPNDPQPSAGAFARRVLEASDADASIVFPIEGPPEIEVIDEFESASFRALDAARSKATPEARLRSLPRSCCQSRCDLCPRSSARSSSWSSLLACTADRGCGYRAVLGPIEASRSPTA